MFTHYLGSAYQQLTVYLPNTHGSRHFPTNIQIYEYTHISYNSCVFSTNMTSSCFHKQPKFMFGLEQPDGRNADIPSSSATKCQLQECARRDDHDGCLPSVSGCVLRHILIFTKIEVSVYRNLSNEPKQQVMSRNIWLSRLGGFASLPL